MSNENDNPNESDMNDVSTIYQSTRNDEPSAALDAAILAQAEEAVAPKRKRPAWIAPVALAATVLLGVNLTVNLKDYSSDPDVFMESSIPAAQRADKPAARISAPYDKTAATDELSELVTSTPLPSYENTIVDADSEEDEAPAVARQLPAPRSSTDNGTYALDAAGVPTRQEPVDSYAYYADPGSTANTARTEAEGAARRANEQRRKREIQHSVAQSLPRKEREAEIAELENQQHGAEPKAMAHAPGPRVMPETVTPSPASASTSPELAAVTTQSSATSAGSERQASEPAEHPKVVAALERQRSLTSRLPAAPQPVPELQLKSQQELESGDSELEEIIVAGNSISDVDDSPHRRLAAKDQVARNARRLTNPTLSITGDQADPSQGTAGNGIPAPSTPVYVCDLSALGIDTDAIETAKVQARTVEPPRNALTWPTFIRELANEGDYVSACTHLAAYQQLFPGVAMIELLPVTIPGDD